jgi:translation initiation factor IF-2
MARSVQIQDSITVGALAEALDIPVSSLIGELMKNGVLATVNERIDFDTASIIVGELGLDVELSKGQEESSNDRRTGREKNKSGETRPPVVAVMGHVDHGKTSLLDAITGQKTTTGEAGGITQHISAYQITHNRRKVTFLDTPGHEAFAAIREHGAQLTDVVVIVVAADDGVKPQTLEAIRFARQSGAKIIVALNKIDKEGADINRVKQQLSEQNLMTEDWGGDTVAVEVSAKEKKNLDQLLDMVLLVADVEDLKAETKQPARGLIIEAHMEKGRGPVAVVLVESGVLRKNDYVYAGGSYAKVKNLESTDNSVVSEAGPSTPAVITGFKTLPRFGDDFIAVKSEKEAKKLSSKIASERSQAGSAVDISGSDLIRLIDKKTKVNELNILVKADVQGSLKSIIDSLRALNTDEVAVRVVGSGVGSITEKDIHLASTSEAIIYGFNIEASSTIKQLASRDRLPLRLYKIIYELIDDAKVELSKLLPPEIIRKDHGRLVVKGIFKTTKTEIICGGEVTKGSLVAPSLAEIHRDNEVIANVEVVGLKRGPQDVSEVQKGEMCGVNLRTVTRINLQEGDRLEFYSQKVVERDLE